MNNQTPSSPRAERRRLQKMLPDKNTTHRIIYVELINTSKAGIKYSKQYPYKITVEQWNTLVSQSQ